MKLLLTLLIFSIPLGNILRMDFGGGFALIPSDIILALLAVTMFSKYIQKSRELLSDSIYKYIVFFSLFSAFSLALNAISLSAFELFVSFGYLLRLLLYMQLLFVPVFLSKTDKKIFLKYLLYSGLVTVLLGLGQYFLYPDLRNLIYLGWDDHYFRLFGTFLDPNFSGAFFVLLVIMTVHLYMKDKKKIFIAFAGVSLIALLLTYSRSSYISLVSGMFIYSLASKYRRIGFVLIGLFAIGIVLLPRNLPTEGVDLLRTASIQARFGEYQEAIYIFKEKPLWGVGFNAYRYAQYKHGFLDNATWLASHSGAGVPNSYLFVLATSGIIGLGMYLNIWRHVYTRIYKSTQAPYLLAIVGAMMTHALFENTLFYPFIMIWLFMAVSLTSEVQSMPSDA